MMCFVKRHWISSAKKARAKTVEEEIGQQQSLSEWNYFCVYTYFYFVFLHRVYVVGFTYLLYIIFTIKLTSRLMCFFFLSVPYLYFIFMTSLCNGHNI